MFTKFFHLLNKARKTKTKRGKKIKFLIKLSITLAFSFWVIFSTNWKDVWFYLSEVNVYFLIFYVIFLFLGFFISSKKWFLLARFKNINLPQIEFFKLYFIATFINNFMPSFIAGDAFKTYNIGKEKDKYPEAASTVMMDRITGLIAATILAIFFLLINIQKTLENKVLFISLLILLASLSLDIIMPRIKKIKFLRELLFKFAPEKILQFLRNLGSYTKDSKIIKVSLFYSFLFSIVGVGLLNYILFLALGIKIEIIDYLSVIFLISIISALPISINNIGLKEWAYVTFFGIFAVDPAAAITVAIMSRTIQMVASLFALPIYLEKRK